MTKSLSIAIDGPAASGKGTISRRIAAHYGLRHLDTGLLYRGVASMVRERGVEMDDVGAVGRLAAGINEDVLERPDLRDEDIGNIASVVASHPPVRAALLNWQRAFAGTGAVLDGRDIGTVVLPNADAKLFVTADADVRAARRWRELSKTVDISYRRVLDDIEDRDRRDSQRSAAPMTRADDADLLDTSEMTIEEAVVEALKMIEARLA